VSKRWRIVLSDLGGDAVKSELTVDAENWMSALRQARGELGESGAVPPGSSCAVAPDGKVTILDPVERRRFVLSVDTSESFTPPPVKQGGPKIPADPTPPPEATNDAAAKKKAARKTMAYVPPQPAQVGAAPAKKKKVGRGTMAYIPPSALPQQKQEVVVGSTPPPAASEPVAQPSPEAEPAPAAQPPPKAEAPKEQVGGWSAAPNPSRPPPPAESEPAQSEPSPPPPAEAESKPDHPGAEPQYGEGWQLLLSRDEDPSETNPLRYRERAYAVAPNTSADDAERIARERLAALRELHSAAPKGKFFNLAVFDHEWEGRPQRPPLVVLQFKDWHGQIVVDRPHSRVQTQQAAAPAAPTPESRRTSTDEHDRRLADAFEACQDLFFLSSPAEALGFVVKLFGDLLPAEAASALLYDIDANVFRFVVVEGPGKETRQGQEASPRVGLMGAAAGMVGAAVRATSADERLDPGIDGREGITLRNVLYLPLSHQGRLLGMVKLINRIGRDEFSPADGDLAVYVGGQLAEFLHNARIKAAR